MTNQEIFDTVLNHLFTQKVAAYDTDEHGCSYRDPNGNTCAVGCLISTEQYHPDMEGLGVAELREHFPHLAPLFPLEQLPLLVRLQQLHDTYMPRAYGTEPTRSLADVAKRAQDLAANFGLIFTHPQGT